MRSDILFFGPLADLFGRTRSVDLPEAGCTPAELRRLLGDEDGALRRPGIRIAIDQVVAGEDARILPGQEIAFLSPLSGG